MALVTRCTRCGGSVVNGRHDCFEEQIKELKDRLIKNNQELLIEKQKQLRARNSIRRILREWHP